MCPSVAPHRYFNGLPKNSEASTLTWTVIGSSARTLTGGAVRPKIRTMVVTANRCHGRLMCPSLRVTIVCAKPATWHRETYSDCMVNLATHYRQANFRPPRLLVPWPPKSPTEFPFRLYPDPDQYSLEPERVSGPTRNRICLTSEAPRIGPGTAPGGTHQSLAKGIYVFRSNPADRGLKPIQTVEV